MEASGGGTPDLLTLLEVLGYVGIYGYKGYVGGPKGGHEAGGRAPGGWARPLPRGFLEAPLAWTPSLPSCFPSKNKFREVSGQLDSV